MNARLPPLPRLQPTPDVLPVRHLPFGHATAAIAAQSTLLTGVTHVLVEPSTGVPLGVFYVEAGEMWWWRAPGRELGLQPPTGP